MREKPLRGALQARASCVSPVDASLALVGFWLRIGADAMLPIAWRSRAIPQKMTMPCSGSRLMHVRDGSLMLDAIESFIVENRWAIVGFILKAFAVAAVSIIPMSVATVVWRRRRGSRSVVPSSCCFCYGFERCAAAQARQAKGER